MTEEELNDDLDSIYNTVFRESIGDHKAPWRPWKHDKQNIPVLAAWLSRLAIYALENIKGSVAIQ